MSRLSFLLSAAFLWPHFAPAQVTPGAIAPPVLGFVLESRSATLQTVWGIPGAATLGDPLDFGYPITNAVAAPRLGFALTVSARDHAVRLAPLPNSNVPPAPLPNAMAAPDLMVLSPTGSAAVVYKQATDKQATGQLQVITGLPAAPVAVSLAPPALSNPAAGLAVADDGSEALLSTSAGDGLALWLVPSDDGAAMLLLPGGTVAFAFRPNSRDAVAATGNGDVVLLQDVGAQMQVRHIPGPSFFSINGVQLSADGKRIYASGAAGVAAFDLDSGTWTEISCACSPRGLYPFGSGDLFRLTEASQGPIFLLDVSSALNMRVWFIPQDRRSAMPRQSAHE